MTLLAEGSNVHHDHCDHTGQDTPVKTGPPVGGNYKLDVD